MQKTQAGCSSITLAGALANVIAEFVLPLSGGGGGVRLAAAAAAVAVALPVVGVVGAAGDVLVLVTDELCLGLAGAGLVPLLDLLLLFVLVLWPSAVAVELFLLEEAWKGSMRATKLDSELRAVDWSSAAVVVAPPTGDLARVTFAPQFAEADLCAIGDSSIGW